MFSSRADPTDPRYLLSRAICTLLWSVRRNGPKKVLPLPLLPYLPCLPAIWQKQALVGGGQEAQGFAKEYSKWS